MATKIEDIWSELRQSPTRAQRRVDPDHALDLYADFERPNRPGLVLFCEEQPADDPSLSAISIVRAQRQDGQWSLRISLEEPQLVNVFGQLCADIIETTRDMRTAASPSGAVLSRLGRWRALMQAQRGGLGDAAIKGLIGELTFLEQRVLPEIGPAAAIAAWTGPLGAEQDFRLPSGRKIEVKAIDRDAVRVHINGLGQLDGGSDPLQLAIVRLEPTGREAHGAVTLELLIDRLRAQLSAAPAALSDFEASLGFAGWREGVPAGSIVVRVSRIEIYDVDGQFPRLTRRTVPPGILEAGYDITLPPVDQT